MHYENINVPGFQVIGIKTRTTNAAEMQGAGKIANLWNTFYSTQVLNQIENKLDNSIVAVYFDYESDANGAYSLLVGVKVAAGTKVPDGMELINIPTQSYAKFTSEKGEMPQIVIDTWQTIWGLTNRSELKRNYTFDMEVYDKRACDPKSSEIDVLIAAKA